METKLSKGDWIVHANYGLGQVVGEDKKALGGVEKEYYKVKTQAAVYWLQKNRVDAETIREVASEYKFKKALKALKASPTEMNKDYRKRRARINEVMTSNSVIEFAELMRDLYWHRRSKSLNDVEKRTLDLLKKRFAREWSVAAEIQEEAALTRLENVLGAAVKN
ncbi:MAG TPA: CarD family transcriptional regulator [Anaerolineales bacterium]|nr:CarD family transcriptional regulator [Anaerolineales bacterium]